MNSLKDILNLLRVKVYTNPKYLDLGLDKVKKISRFTK